MKANTFNGRNGHKTPVLEKELIPDSETLETVTTETSATAEARVVTPEIEKEVPPKRKKPTGLILAALGVGAIAAGTFGYHYWQYASTHQETDNATVVGNIHQVSTRIPGTVSQVLVNC
jgi:membrane fusion protein (multidrug efflux system)